MIARAPRTRFTVEPYVFRDDVLPAGSTLGSPCGVVVLKATGAIEKFFSPEAGKDVFGSALVRYWDARSGIELRPRRGKFLIAPERQEHHIEYAGGLAVRECVFALNAISDRAGRPEPAPPAAFYRVELRNESAQPLDIASYAAVALRGGFEQPTSARYDESRRAVFARSEDNPALVRVAGCSAQPENVVVTEDRAILTGARLRSLEGRPDGTADDPIVIFALRHRIEPGERAAFHLALTFAHDGEAAAARTFDALPSCEDALEQTQRFYAGALSRTLMTTPDPQINRGTLWAKVNMLRSLLLTDQGWCFVNDPTKTTKSVARDTCWFAFGADYVAPWFVADSLRWFADHLTPAGMAVEWYDNRTGETETYGLDVNDNTPLLILALRHHFCVTGDREFLEAVYPSVVRAARYILSKRGGRGLIWCRAPGTGSRGIVGWRNVIAGERLAGATTELNSECYAALRAASLLAQEMGDAGACDEFAREAGRLRTAINEHLLDHTRNLYYLAIDEDGHARSDVKSDLVFPILFGVADDDVAAKIVATLTQREFWSDAGLRTTPRDAIDYSPTRGSGLLGGVWAGPTFWFASAAARFNPEFMAGALASTFGHYAEDPLRYKTVPGQFCEWLHGETLSNEGMMLSPWFAPKYLWAALEGAAGLASDLRDVSVEARIPANWQWLAVRNVPLRGRDVSWFTVRMEGLLTYATDGIATIQPRHRYDEDATDDVEIAGQDVASIALRRKDSIVVMLGNTLDCSVPASVAFAAPPGTGDARLRVYDSLSKCWREEEAERARLRDGIAVLLDRRGFCLIEVALSGGVVGRR